MSRSRYFEEEDDPYSNPSLFEALLVVNNIKKGTEVFPKCKIEDSNLIDSSLTYDSCEEDVVDETQLLDRSDYSAFRQEISESLDRPKNRFLKKQMKHINNIRDEELFMIKYRDFKNDNRDLNLQSSDEEEDTEDFRVTIKRMTEEAESVEKKIFFKKSKNKSQHNRTRHKNSLC